jgi:hypothetical protein
VIEQATGRLRQRFGVTAEARWRVLRRHPSATGTGVRVLAEQVIAADELTEPTDGLVPEAARAHAIE